MTSLFIFILGLVIGSFLNVCIYRIPRGESVVSPPSHCPDCGRRLGPLDLVPLLSYIFLRGRCRTCQKSISPRYFLVELITGLLFLLVYCQVGLVPQLINYLLLSAILMAVFFIDLEHCIIPNKVLAAGVLLQLTVNFWTRQIPFFDALTGFFAGGAMLLAIALFKPGAMGGGDIKLVAVLGLFLGWQKIIMTFFVAALLGAVIGLILIAVKGKGLKDMIPFGPFLAVAALICLLWSQPLLAWYVGLFF